MKRIYSVQSLISLLDDIPGAREGNPEHELVDAGTYLSEHIKEYCTNYSPLLDTLSAPQLTDDDDEQSYGDSIPAIPIFHFPNDLDHDSAIEKLASAAGKHYRSQILHRGTDALAYYYSFHEKTYQWGIYLPISGIAWVSYYVFGHLPISATAKMQLAAFMLLEHEKLHFGTDCMIAQMELLTSRAIFWPTKGSLRTGEAKAMEESIANARMLRRLRFAPGEMKKAGAYQSALTFSKSQPPGYRDGHLVAKTRHFYESQILDHAQLVFELGTGNSPPYGVEFQHLNPHDRPYDLDRCPIHIISDEHRLSLPDLGMQFIQAIPEIVESKQFSSDLRRLSQSAQQLWHKTKAKLVISVRQNSLDFKPWHKDGQPNVFSVRVDRSVRAHLRFENKTQLWFADRIGSHKEMGHG